MLSIAGRYTRRQLSPEGTTVGSQGRKPLDNGIIEQQSPRGAADSGKDRMVAATNPPDLHSCVWANLGLLPLRAFCRPSGAWLLGRLRSRGLRPWLPTLAPPEPEQLAQRDRSAIGCRNGVAQVVSTWGTRIGASLHHLIVEVCIGFFERRASRKATDHDEQIRAPHSVPKGRQSVARGVSPWTRASSNNKAPEGRQTLASIAWAPPPIRQTGAVVVERTSACSRFELSVAPLGLGCLAVRGPGAYAPGYQPWLLRSQNSLPSATGRRSVGGDGVAQVVSIWRTRIGASLHPPIVKVCVGFFERGASRLATDHDEQIRAPHSVPKGRQSVARGVSPWTTAPSSNRAPAGNAVN